MAEEQAKVKLHWLNGSRAQGTLFLLEHLQIPYELDIHHRGKDMLAPPELEKIHPLGKSPVVSITAPGSADPIVLAESSFIVEYLCEHFPNGKALIAKRWKDGQEGKIGGETDEWMRYQYLMYYAEGSFMSSMVTYFILSALKGDTVPFLVRPLTRVIANQVIGMVSFPHMRKHFTLLELYLSTAPGGKYLCGDHLTAPDFLFAFALIAGLSGSFDEIGRWEKGSFEKTFPKLWAYMQRLEKEPAWKRSADKIREIEGSFKILP